MWFRSAVATVALVPCLTVGVVAQPADFGTPPSGTIPILFNDRHVYAKPDELKQGRLLAAIVRGRTILVPLRSMFEQAGATVEYDPLTRSTIVRRPGTVVEVTVGVAEVRINGELRPLDVPPVAFGNDVLVPVRVIAEALGAYVQYERDIHAVVIRYLVAANVPVPLPTPVELKLSSPSPQARVVPRPIVPKGPPIPVGTPPSETYVVADVEISPKTANAFVPAATGTTGESLDIRGATEFSFFDVPFVLGGEYSDYAALHPAGYVTNLGGVGNSFVPSFMPRDSQFDIDFGAQISPQKFYIAASYAMLGNNYGYPMLRGFGLGLEKLPVLSNRLSYDARVFYYPNLSGTCSTAQCPNGPFDVSVSMFTYEAGLTYALGPFFLDAGYRGDHARKKAGLPVDVTHDGPFVGVGLHF